IPSAFRAFATRWPPEIIWVSPEPFPDAVWSALGVVVALTSAFSSRSPRPGVLPGGRERSMSIQVVDRALRVVGEVQRVVADEAVGDLAVAGLERFDDVHVVDDRALGPVVVADGPAADRAHVHQKVLDELQDHRRLAELDDPLVEAQVGDRVLVE